MQNYMAVFEDALDQLAVLGDIAQDSIKLDTKPAGEEITRILRDQQLLESRFHDLTLTQDALKSLPNKTKYKENQFAITDVTNELQLSTHFLARNLKSHPSVAQNLVKIQNERSAVQALISKSIRELKECKFDSMVNLVAEEKKKKNTLFSTINREKDASELLRELQKEVGNEKRLLDEEVHDRNLVIQQLKDTIQEINRLTNSEQKYIKKETKAHENSVKLKCQAQESNLLDELTIKKKAIQVESKCHDQIVDFLTRQRKNMDGQIQEWILKYETDTEAKVLELENLKQKRTSDLDKFEELVAQYEELEKIVEEDRQIKLKEAEDMRALTDLIATVVKIQRWFRKLHKTKQKTPKTTNKNPKKSPKKDKKSPAKSPSKSPSKKKKSG